MGKNNTFDYNFDTKLFTIGRVDIRRNLEFKSSDLNEAMRHIEIHKVEAFGTVKVDKCEDGQEGKVWDTFDDIKLEIDMDKVSTNQLRLVAGKKMVIDWQQVNRTKEGCRQLAKSKVIKTTFADLTKVNTPKDPIGEGARLISAARASGTEEDYNTALEFIDNCSELDQTILISLMPDPPEDRDDENDNES